MSKTATRAVPRPYKAQRRPAPPLDDLLYLRGLGDSYADIAERYGCHRRTVYAALDRAADAGKLSPVALITLYPDDKDARLRLWKRIRAAHKAGVEVADWNLIEQARAVRADRLAATAS